jgi:tripeptide aminopeptidase
VRDPYGSTLAAELADDALARLIRYARIDTQSDRDVPERPSTAKQLDLSRLLAEELRGLGLEEIDLTEAGHLFATLQETGRNGGRTIGLLAHVDTSPDAPGAGVDPQVWRDYDGGEIVLPGDETQILSPATSPLLAERVGHDIVTSDGTTLLGADDKAGVAEIMAAVAWLVGHPEVRRPRVRIGFTVDEETGHGTETFDIARFGADFAYTVDGGVVGEIQNETFSAIELTVTFHGVGVHPGDAKGTLVNPIKLASRFIESLPAAHLSPETTEDREGFVHPYKIAGGANDTSVTLIVRDHDGAKLEEHYDLVVRLAQEAVADEPRARLTLHRWDQYRNMGEALAQVPHVLDAALEAARRVGLEPRLTSIRGGTDGSRLTEMGLATPNLYTGGNEYHSVKEWISVQDLAISAATVVELVRLLAEDGAGEA